MEYIIIKDDVDLVAERVQYHVKYEFEEVEIQRIRIRNYLADIKKVLEKIQEAQR
jgi:hypothetical protein